MAIVTHPSEHMMCAGMDQAPFRGLPGASPQPYFMEQVRLHGGCGLPASSSPQSKAPGFKPGLLGSDTVHRKHLTAVLSSQKPPARCQTLLNPGKFIWGQVRGLAMLGQMPSLWPFGPGQHSQGCGWQWWGMRQGKAVEMSSPPAQPRPPPSRAD